MRILIAALGSRGDVQPGLALGLGLQAAGHDVTVSAPPDFAGWSHELGLPFVPSGDSVEAFMRTSIGDIGGNPLRVVRALNRIIDEQVPLWFEQTRLAAESANVIISCHQYAANSIAEKLGIPCFSVLYQPTLLRSSRHPPMIISWQGLPAWVNRALWILTSALLEKTFRGPINLGRSKLGLAPVESFEAYIRDAPFFLATDPSLVAIPPDWSDLDVIPTGPWFYEDPAGMPPDVEEFLQSGPPPVYVGFGSMPARDPAHLTEVVVKGAASGGRRVLMSKGWAGIGEGKLSPTVHVVHSSMPHHKLFPRVAAVIHHGGAGTTATALRSGVPQVLIPHLMDQFYYAHRMAELGLAPPGIPASRLSAKRLENALNAALALPPEPRREAAARLQQTNGIARAIRVIEARVAN